MVVVVVVGLDVGAAVGVAVVVVVVGAAVVVVVVGAAVVGEAVVVAAAPAAAAAASLMALPNPNKSLDDAKISTGSILLCQACGLPFIRTARGKGI